MQTIFLMMGAGKPGGFEPLFLLGFVAILYFFMLRPQAKKQKETKKFSEEINTGDRIITIGGIHGKISKRNDDGTYLLEAERNSYMIIEASAISMEMTMAYRKKLEPAAPKTKA
jgi:preprotein translocase subunit YajC